MRRREAMTLLGAPMIAVAGEGEPTGRDSGRSEWEGVLMARLPLYGHRNWIVVADSAYPLQSRQGIETVVSGMDHYAVLERTLRHLTAAKHVRPTVFQDKELRYVQEGDAPGVNGWRQEIAGLLQGLPATEMPHADVINLLDTTAQTFSVLIIKTTLTIPYTSVFFQLDCAYWGADAEKRLRERM